MKYAFRGNCLPGCGVCKPPSQFCIHNGMVALHAEAAVHGQVIKPAIDKLEYRIVVLENGPKALVIHDADTDKAAAAMDVRAPLIILRV